MANTSITIRVDEELKKEAEVFFAEIGMNMSTAFSVFVRQCLREQRIPFEIGRPGSAPAQDAGTGAPGKDC